MLLFGMFLAITLTVGATFAWDLYEDKETNKFGTGKYLVNLKENFHPSEHWAPDTSEVKEVFVKNNGDYPAFVRLSVAEVLMAFEVDTLETGNLQMVTSEGSNKVKVGELTTWKVGNSTYKPTGSSAIYRPKTVLPSDVATTGKGVIYTPDNLTAREATDLRYIDLLFSNQVKVNASQPTPTSEYWLYGGDGYFYYSEALMPGKDTSYLLEKTILSESTPNRLKGALYKILIDMDAGDTALRTLDDWDHDLPGDDVYEMLKDKIG